MVSFRVHSSKSGYDHSQFLPTWSWVLSNFTVMLYLLSGRFKVTMRDHRHKAFFKISINKNSWRLQYEFPKLKVTKGQCCAKEFHLYILISNSIAPTSSTSRLVLYLRWTTLMWLEASPRLDGGYFYRNSLLGAFALHFHVVRVTRPSPEKTLFQFFIKKQIQILLTESTVSSIKVFRFFN